MNTKHLSIQGIPAVVWGSPSEKLILAVHGDQSHKEDVVIQILAEEAEKKGYQTLSFDLPEHGDRKQEQRVCNPQNAVEDLEKILLYAQESFSHLRLFGCSMGAYFSLLAYKDAPLQQALFLSPVVDMVRIIQNMMTWFGIREKDLQQKQEIETPIQTLSWEYYQYVRSHPIQWKKPTAILYGSQDNLCERDVLHRFVEQSPADVTIMEQGEHFFHTEEQLAFFRQWLQNTLGA